MLKIQTEKESLQNKRGAPERVSNGRATHNAKIGFENSPVRPKIGCENSPVRPKVGCENSPVRPKIGCEIV